MTRRLAALAIAEPARLRLRLRGVVQGVGFRPFAYGLAKQMSLVGFVRNDADGVVVEIEGARANEFLAALEAGLPPLARLDAADVEALAPRGDQSFAILESQSGQTRARIPPDAAVCPACLDDLFNPASRFHLYPFVNCTHCGPRFTVARQLPYDRARTSMEAFPMCAACASDYRDAGNRRFHAETIACPDCGPRLSRGMAEIVGALRAGKIVALKGIGGYHLMCDAGNETSILELRRRKKRDAKPFAIMVANEASIGLFAEASAAERALLRHPAHPIVVMDSLRKLPEALAPRLGRIGVMLPYAPVHHLLFHEAAAGKRDASSEFAIVATSANPGGEPLITDDAEALAKLAGIADLIVTHDREIVTRADDSVMGVIDGAPSFIRRARGFVPEPADLGADGPVVLACGGHLKATITVTRGREAFVCQHIGDLSDAATFRFYEESARHLLFLLDVKPEAVACDLHPDYLSTRYAEATGLPLLRVQHHAAHIAAIGAEHQISGPLLGVALDGHGMGDDGEAWGGELMRLDGARFSRLGHLAPLALLGGDRAAREPWRMGLAALNAIGRLDEAKTLWRHLPEVSMVANHLRGARIVPQTTSMGRLFDAAAALLGICLRQDFEGQAAMELEALVRAPRALEDGYVIADGVLDFSPLLACLVTERPSPTTGADLFHGTLIEGLVNWIGSVARAGELVALGGGCMMNRILAEGLARGLRQGGFVPLLARAFPPNDGGLSLGQAAMARALLI